MYIRHAPALGIKGELAPSGVAMRQRSTRGHRGVARAITEADYEQTAN